MRLVGTTKSTISRSACAPTGIAQTCNRWIRSRSGFARRSISTSRLLARKEKPVEAAAQGATLLPGLRDDDPCARAGAGREEAAARTSTIVRVCSPSLKQLGGGSGGKTGRVVSTGDGDGRRRSYFRRSSASML